VQPLMKRAGTGAWLGTFGTTAIILGMNLVTGVVIARLLQPEGRGALTAILYWPNCLVEFGGFSLNEAVTFLVAREDSVAKTGVVKRTAVTLALVLGACSAAVGFGLLPWLFGADRAHLIGVARFYMLVFVPVTFVNITLLAFEQGRFRFRLFNGFRLLQPVTYLLGLAGLWLSGSLTVSTVAYAILISLLVCLCVQFYFSAPVSPLWNRESAWNLMRTGCQFHGVNILIFASVEADRALVLLWASNTNVGLYAVATTIASASTTLVVQSVNAILFPRMSSLSDTENIRALLAKSVRIVMLLVGAANLSLLILSVWLIPWLFGASYREAIPPAMGLLLAYCMKAVRQVMERSLRGTGRIRPGIHSEASSLVIMAILAYPAYYYAGLLGMALAVLISQVVALAVVAWYARRYFEITMAEWWGLRIAVVAELWRLGKQVLRSRAGHVSV
jgi:O-antigen/teichoic acid export membrane protein